MEYDIWICLQCIYILHNAAEVIDMKNKQPKWMDAIHGQSLPLMFMHCLSLKNIVYVFWLHFWSCLRSFENFLFNQFIDDLRIRSEDLNKIMRIKAHSYYR